ncbi:MAG: hypothetical protein NVS3B17_21550 [Vulcanimicrobiaceae bacterium]
MQDYAVARSPFASLQTRFGSSLAHRRDGLGASWSLDGRIATVSPRADGTLDATFTDRVVSDVASTTPVVAVYRPKSGRYALGPAGTTRMVDDMIAFFSGVREPHFAFARLDDAGARRT